MHRVYALYRSSLHKAQLQRNDDVRRARHLACMLARGHRNQHENVSSPEDTTVRYGHPDVKELAEV